MKQVVPVLSEAPRPVHDEYDQAVLDWLRLALSADATAPLTHAFSAEILELVALAQQNAARNKPNMKQSLH